mmetsp:Transcript_30967/g.35370  ORF Transcript_30967/g.35370 Transcript_30967/m.35370 type:complete len:120 (-) Transcript_30967:1134-1493(-)
MNRAEPEESYCESEFDIYQPYVSNAGSNVSASANSDQESGNDKLSFERQRLNTHNQRRSKNISEVVVSDDPAPHKEQLSQLFKRPSLTLNAERAGKKKSVARKDAHKFRKQIESCFVHK